MLDKSDHILPEARCPGCGRPTELDGNHDPVSCARCERAAHDIDESILDYEDYEREVY